MQGEQNNRLAQSVFKLVNILLCNCCPILYCDLSYIFKQDDKYFSEHEPKSKVFDQSEMSQSSKPTNRLKNLSLDSE